MCELRSYVKYSCSSRLAGAFGGMSAVWAALKLLRAAPKVEIKEFDLPEMGTHRYWFVDVLAPGAPSPGAFLLRAARFGHTIFE